MSHKQHSESGRHRGERRKHDRAVRAQEEEVYKRSTSPGIKIAMGIIAVIAVVTLTVLFMGGFIHW